MKHKKEPHQYWIPVAILAVFVYLTGLALQNDRLKRLEADQSPDGLVAATIYQATNDLSGDMLTTVSNQIAAADYNLNNASNSLVEKIAEHQRAASVAPATYGTNYYDPAALRNWLVAIQVTNGLPTNFVSMLNATNGFFGGCMSISNTYTDLRPHWGDAIAIWSANAASDGMMIEFADHDQWLSGRGPWPMDCAKAKFLVVWDRTNGFAK